ncbi:MAG TPA: hypothetical protein ENI23_07935 [bacterium]|nr:hypothetical protein [bacterium]
MNSPDILQSINTSTLKGSAANYFDRAYGHTLRASLAPTITNEPLRVSTTISPIVFQMVLVNSLLTILGEHPNGHGHSRQQRILEKPFHLNIQEKAHGSRGLRRGMQRHA